MPNRYLCAIHKQGCTAVVSRWWIHKLYVRMHLVCHQLLSSSSVPHAHTAIIVAGGQCGLVVGVVAYGAWGRKEGKGQSTYTLCTAWCMCMRGLYIPQFRVATHLLHRKVVGKCYLSIHAYISNAEESNNSVHWCTSQCVCFHVIAIYLSFLG